MKTHGLMAKSVEFVDYLEEWLAGLEQVSLRDLVIDPARTAVVSVDIL